MSIDFYPAKLVEWPEGKKAWENVVPMEGDCERLRIEARNNEDFEGSAFEPNPEYFPFSTLNMANGNAYAILSLLGIDSERCAAPVEEVFKKAHNYLFAFSRTRDMEQYVAERVFSLREMARLGIARGATHIVWC